MHRQMSPEGKRVLGNNKKIPENTRREEKEFYDSIWTCMWTKDEIKNLLFK